jgi:hypothetical protein
LGSAPIMLFVWQELLVISFKPEVYVNIKNSLLTSNKTRHFTIPEMSLLMLFNEIIAACSENHTKLKITIFEQIWSYFI